MPNISTPLSYGEGLELNRFSWQAAGLVGWWPLGSPKGPILPDLSGYGNHAIATESLGASTGERAWGGKWAGPEGRHALDVNASLASSQTYYAKTLTTGVITSQTLTVSFWHRATLSTGGQQVYFNIDRFSGSGSNMYVAGQTLSSRSRVEVVWVEEDASYTSLGSGNDGLFVVGQWCLYTIVRRGTTGAWYCDIYGNGDFFETKGPTSENPPTGDDYRLFFGGYRGGSLNLPSQGYLDDFRLYNRALGPNEIKAIYLDTRDGSYGDLAAKPQQFYNIPFTTSTPPAEEDTIDKLLIENDDVLLLEDGTYVLLQSATVEGPLKPQSDIRVGPSLEFDVAAEVIQENLRGGGRITVCNGGIVSSVWSSGPRLVPNTQVVVNRYDNKWQPGPNQGDPVA